MLSLSKRIFAFSKLSSLIKLNLAYNKHDEDPNAESFNQMLDDSFYQNQWFTPANSRFALTEIAEWLCQQNLQNWVSKYSVFEEELNSQRVGIIMAGNIPLVGFHDLLCVLVSGHKAVIKLSNQDRVLINWLLQKLIIIEPEFQDKICIEENLVKNLEAVIATGSDNSSRYFDYYFSKYPNIIRRHRNSVAVIAGDETKEEIGLIANDIFQYFGLGCRNVSKIFVPKGYDFEMFFESIEQFSKTLEHTKYFNNYEYNKAIFLINKVEHLDNGFLLVTKNSSMHSPVGVLYYDEYSEIDQVEEILKREQEKIQCVVSKIAKNEQWIKVGEAQHPSLSEYADNVDTMIFLKTLSNKL